jgi:hypothetical protein
MFCAELRETAANLRSLFINTAASRRNISVYRHLSNGLKRERHLLSVANVFPQSNW